MLTLSPKVRKIVSIAFFAAIVFLGARIFSVESADCEVVFRMEGRAKPGLERIEARLFEKGGNDVVGKFLQRYPIDFDQQRALGNWPLVVSAGEYRIEGEVRAAGKEYSFSLKVNLVDGDAAVVTIPAQ